MAQETLLKKYIRKPNREPFGIVVATKNGVGWSVCGELDRYNADKGLKIAINRANYQGPKTILPPVDINGNKEVAAEICKMINAMETRRKKYFKVD